MELEQAIYSRRSIRKYIDKPVEKEILEKIINAGMWAPSACNVQGWKFIVIDDKKVMNDIIENGAAAFLKNAHQAIVVLYDNQTDNTEYNDYVQSASACIQNMLLMAHSLSVGTCWVNFLPSKKKFRKILNVPSSYDPIALISLGYYDQKINDRPRKYPQNELIYWNKYDGSVAENKKGLKLRIKRIMRKVYFALPPSIKKKLGFILNKKEKKFDN